MKRIVWVGFGIFCLLAASGWLVAPVPVPVPEGIRDLLYGVVGVAAVVVNGRRPWCGVRSTLRVSAVGVMLFGVTGMLVAWAGRYVPGTSGTVVFGLVPAVTVLVVAWEEEEARRFLGPGIVALGGLLLVVPFEVPGFAMGRVAVGVLCLAVVLTAVSGVWMWQLLRNFDGLQAVAIVGLANSVFLLGVGIFDDAFRLGWGGWSVESGLSGALEVTQVLLLIWLLGRMSPVRLAGRYLLIPLLTVVEGYFLMKPELTFRMGSGILILAGGAAWLLFRGWGEEASSLSLH